jgi:hypothetical protein
MKDTVRSESQIRRLVAVGLFAVAAATYLWLARSLFQDDAFIHLRIATNLHNLGFYSFNGDKPA